MANENLVMFKKGLQADLPKSGSIENGFYLTTDTHRLYIGSNGTTALLNSAVAFYANETALIGASAQFKPSEGDMAFVNDANALCVYKNGAWNQVNVNTDTSLYSAVFSNGEKTTVNGKNAIKYVLTVKEQDVDGSIVKNIDGTEKLTTAELVITDDMVTSLVVDVKVDVEASVTEGVATVTTNGAGSDGDGFKVKGEDGITIKTETGFDGFVIDGTTYGLELDGTTVQLRDSDNELAGDSVEFIDDDKWIEVSNDNGKIKVAHAGKSSAEITPAPGTAKELNDGTEITVVTGLTIEKGHITGYETTKYTAQDTKPTVEVDIDTNKDLKITLKDEEGDAYSTDSVDISSTLTVNGQKYTIEPTGAITLPEYYTKEEVDVQHRAINAMVYKGVVNKNDDLPTTGEIGWTYKVGVAGTYAGKECGVGDLLIANGTEVDGVLTDITWDYIDTSDFEDTTYDLQAKDNEIVLHNNVTLEDDKLALADDDIVILTAANDTLSVAHKAITISKPTAAKKQLAQAEAFTVITGMVDDGHGHITEINTTEFKLPASGDKVEADAANVKLSFKDVANELQGSIDLDATGPIAIAGVSSDNKNLIATISHDKVTKNNTTGTAAPAHGGTFDVVEAVTYNDYGHVSGVKTTTVTLPTETVYEMEGPTAVTNGVKYELKANNEKMGEAIEVISDNLKVAVSNTQTSINLEWGTF